jgi:hypothetical protein
VRKKNVLSNHTLEHKNGPKFININTAPTSIKKLIKPPSMGLPKLTKKIINAMPVR